MEKMVLQETKWPLLFMRGKWHLAPLIPAKLCPETRCAHPQSPKTTLSDQTLAQRGLLLAFQWVIATETKPAETVWVFAPRNHSYEVSSDPVVSRSQHNPSWTRVWSESVQNVVFGLCGCAQRVSGPSLAGIRGVRCRFPLLNNKGHFVSWSTISGRDLKKWSLLKECMYVTSYLRPYSFAP